MTPGCAATCRTASTTPGMKRRAVERVVPDRQQLAGRAEQHLLVGDQAAQPQRSARVCRPRGPRARRPGRRSSRRARRRAPASAPGLPDQRRGPRRRAGGGVDLVRVVQLDHLDRLVEPGRLLRERHHQDGADGEVGGDQDADAGLRRPPGSRSASTRSSSQPGGADHDVDATVDAVGDVGRRGVRHGELDRHVGATEVAQVVAVVEAPHERRARRRRPTAAHTCDAHSPGRTDHGHLDIAHALQPNEAGAGSPASVGSADGRPASRPRRARPGAPWGPRSGPSTPHRDPVIRPSSHADFQANAALALAKAARPAAARGRRRDRRSPRGRRRLRATSTVSGPGFVNLTLRDDWLAARAADARRRPAPGVPVASRGRSSRSTTPPRTWPRRCTSATCAPPSSATRSPGSWSTSATTSIRQNHIGDWGTPFGMLIEHLLDVGEDSARGGAARSATRTRSTRRRGRKFDADADVRRPGPAAGGPAAGRRPGDAAAVAGARRPVQASTSTRSTRTLGVTLTDEDLAGESMYNDVARRGLRRAGGTPGSPSISDGALCVFLDGFTGREGKPVPLIIRKSDGGYGYATTDLAAIRYRVRRPARRPDRSTSSARRRACTCGWSAPTAREAGWLPPEVEAGARRRSATCSARTARSCAPAAAPRCG